MTLLSFLIADRLRAGSIGTRPTSFIQNTVLLGVADEDVREHRIGPARPVTPHQVAMVVVIGVGGAMPS